MILPFSRTAGEKGRLRELLLVEGATTHAGGKHEPL